MSIEIKWWTDDIEIQKGQRFNFLYNEILLFNKNTSLAIIQNHVSATEGRIVTIFHLWFDTESVTLTLVANLETLSVVFVLLGWRCMWSIHVFIFFVVLQKHFSPSQAYCFCCYWALADCRFTMWQSSLSILFIIC